MPAKTPDSIVRENAGSMTLYVCSFSTNNIDTTDTYASGLGGNVVGYWLNTLPATTTLHNVRVSESEGTFTFTCEEDNMAGKLYILAKT